MNEKNLFSKRFGFKDKEMMQVEDLNEAARAGLWNALEPFLETLLDFKYDVNDYRKMLGTEYFKVPFDKVLLSTIGADFTLIIYKFDKAVGDTIYGFTDGRTAWYEFLDFIEFIYINPPEFLTKAQLKDVATKINKACEDEKIGYRFSYDVKRFISITNAEEFNEVVRAATELSFENARHHICKAIDLFSDRKKSNHENVCNESIHAVESAVKEVTSEKNISAGIRKLKNKNISLHPLLEEAIIKLWAFACATSRHGKGKKIEPKIDEETARYMLITCSAFVNFIAARKENSSQ